MLFNQNIKHLLQHISDVILFLSHVLTVWSCRVTIKRMTIVAFLSVVRKFKSDSQASHAGVESLSGVVAQSSDLTSAKETGNSTGGSSSSCSSRDEDAHCGLSSEKALHYSIILAEINRKYTSVTFRPD